MSINHVFDFTYRAGATILSGSPAFSAVAEDNRILTITKNTSGNLVEVDLDPARIVALIMLASGADLVVTPDGDGQDPIELKDGVPLIWNSDTPYFDCPITAVADQLSIANADTANDAVFTMLCLQSAVAPE